MSNETNVGAIKAKLELDANGFNTEMEKAKESMTQASESSRKTNQRFRDLSKALADTGISTKHIRQIQTELKTVRPELLEKQLKNVELQMRKLGATDEEIAKVKKQIVDARNETRKMADEAQKAGKQTAVMANNLESTGKSANKMGDAMKMAAEAIIGLGAASTLTGLVNTVRSLADEANEMASSINGLSEVSKALGVNVKETTGLAEELANKGFMSLSESASAVKTALSAGLSLDQTRALIYATADAAAYNRESHLEWGEAIVQVVRGIKSGNSELTDAAGITTNLSVMYDRYAQSIGTTAAKLTEAQKVQAGFSGIMAEAALFAGNADTAMQGYTGTQSEFRNTIRTARAELGESYIPVIEKVLQVITPVIKSFSLWAAENKDVVAGLTATTAALLAITAAVSALSIALRAFGIALGPIGWVITAIGAVATGIAAYTAAAGTATNAAKEFAAANEGLNASLEKTKGVLNAEQYQQAKEQMSALTEVIERRNKLEEEYNQRMAEAEAGRGTIENTHALFELADAIKAVDKELKQMGFDNIELARFELRSMEQQTKSALGALVDLTRQEMQSNIAAADKVKTLKSLVAEYESLSKKEKLSETDKQRLADAVKNLKAEYPELNAQLDAEGRWIIENTDALNGYIKGEEARVFAAIEAAKRIIESEKIMNEERIRIAEQAMNKLAEIEGKETKPASFLNDGVSGLLTRGARSAAASAKNVINNEINQARFDINQAAKLLDDLSTGIDAFRKPVPNTTAEEDKKKGSASATKSQTPEQLAQTAYRSALQVMEKRRLLGELTEKEEAETLARLAKQYERYDEIWMDAEKRRQQVVSQMAADEQRRQDELTRANEKAAQDRFDHSAEWIDMETRRMTEKGDSEREIMKMQLDAWTRVRSRYEKDTDYYKRADKSLYDLRMSLRADDERTAKEAAEEAMSLAKEYTNAFISEIDKQKQAELEALEDRRRDISKHYDDLLRIIDKGERGRDRKSIVDEMEKYRLATSEQGKKRYEELQEDLRKHDLEEQRYALQEERDEKLAALDKQKQDINTWYAELKNTIETFNGDFAKIYRATEDERFKAFVETNGKIREEMRKFQQEIQSISVPTSGGTTNAADAYKQSTIYQMQANSAAWHTAKPEDQKNLSNENKKLGASIGATYNSGTGKWTDSKGLPLFHTGRDGATGQTFSLGDRLMPDEIAAILRRDEYVFTPDQVSSLVRSGQPEGRAVTNNYYGPLIENSGDVRLEDDTDIESYHREQEHLARQLIARGERADG